MERLASFTANDFRPRSHIGNYPRFRGAMPGSTVRYQGVTNSFATIPPSSQVLLPNRMAEPFDLHALSTPPAFILDQDQILSKNHAEFTARM